MRNKFLLSLMIVFLGVSPFMSSAKTAASSTNTIKDEIEAGKEAAKNSIEAMKQNVLDKIKLQIDRYVQNVIARFDAATGRLGKLADRIDSRITKIEAKNINESAAKDLLAAARAKIETAKTSTLYIDTDIASSTATSTAALKVEYGAIKTEIQKAKDDIKAAQAALADVVNGLKPGNNKLNNSNTSASSTATSTEN